MEQDSPELRGFNRGSLLVDEDVANIGSSSGIDQSFVLLLWGKVLHITVFHGSALSFGGRR